MRWDGQDDGLVGGPLGSLLIDLKVIDGDEIAGRVAFVLDALEAALSGGVRGHV